jgi:hypothetical protein
MEQEQHTCYLCSSPASLDCERCHQPICAEHTLSFPRMSWQQFSNGKADWKRYLPDPTANDWQACPDCAQVIRSQDTQQQADDRQTLWKMRIFVLALIAIAIAFCALLMFLGTH